MILWSEATDAGELTATFDEAAGQIVVTLAGLEQERRAPEPADAERQHRYLQTLAEEAASVAAESRRLAVLDTRAALSDAVALAALSPYPTPEEQAIIDAQVDESLSLFRALPDPPADVIALAAAVLTLEV